MKSKYFKYEPYIMFVSLALVVFVLFKGCTNQPEAMEICEDGYKYKIKGKTTKAILTDAYGNFLECESGIKF